MLADRRVSSARWRFADNDRPGIMLAEAARRYLELYGVRVGERAVVVTAHDGAIVPRSTSPPRGVRSS